MRHFQDLANFSCVRCTVQDQTAINFFLVILATTFSYVSKIQLLGLAWLDLPKSRLEGTSSLQGQKMLLGHNCECINGCILGF